MATTHILKCPKCWAAKYIEFLRCVLVPGKSQKIKHVVRKISRRLYVYLYGRLTRASDDSDGWRQCDVQDKEMLLIFKCFPGYYCAYLLVVVSAFFWPRWWSSAACEALKPHMQCSLLGQWWEKLDSSACMFRHFFLCAMERVTLWRSVKHVRI